MQASRADQGIKEFLPKNIEQSVDPAGQLLEFFLRYVQAKGVTLYPAQEEAILALFEGNNVILNTPTGSGKSLVAVAMHFRALSFGRRSFYTSPIKALANEKFLSLAAEFGAENVGMMTGDASVNPSAPIICCTAEVLSNLALRRGDQAEVDDVIMDEFHYYSDPDRGAAWQIPLLVLSKARFLLMSATLGKMDFFEEELSKLTGAKTVLISTSERPVPLSFSYVETPIQESIFDLVSAGKSPIYLVNFSQRECAEAAQNLMSVDFCSKDDKAKIAAELEGVRFSSPYGKEVKKILRHGVGIHHAGLLPRYRVIVEKLAQKGLLKVICGTDTLGVGVNVPIRTVLFTKLCKYDGSKTGILSVRDFKQIAGRAGRKGFDDAGFVVAQAPEHVIENLRAESKAAGDAKKLKRLVKKKPPEFGFVMWTKDTFQKLIDSEPESLRSKFDVTHGMLVNVLSREDDGCRAMKQLVSRCHETAVTKERLRKTGFRIFRALLDRDIIAFSRDGSPNKVKINVDFQEDFSLNHSLALYLIDTVKRVDPYSETYALDILSLAESIAENPELILRKQLDRLKTQKMAEMKADGLEFDERIAELEKLEYPKPNREFIYETYNLFVADHPWMTLDNIKPKSIVREMYEGFMTFGEYIREYDLQRSEGLLLRYLAELYKILVQTVPQTAKDEEMNSIVDFLGVMIRQVDSSLLDEWEKIKNPSYVAPVVAESLEDIGVGDITRNKREFTAAIRNEVFHFLKLVAKQDFVGLAEFVKESAGGPKSEAYTQEFFETFADSYSQDHRGPRYDRVGRDPKFVKIVPLPEDPSVWSVTQTFVDDDEHNDVFASFLVNTARAKETGRVFLEFSGFS
jgi:superfamily II RNA helicase